MTAHPASLAAAAAACLAWAAGAGAAFEYPTLKSGQWEMTTTGGAGAPPRKATICLDANTQKALMDQGAGVQKEMCSKVDMRRDGTRYVTDAECKFGNSVVRSRGVMTMIGDTAYRTETTATFDPPLVKDMRESKTVIEGKYVGACRDGLKPGDMVTDTGQKLNINQMQPPPRPPKAN
jgi:hypothetical protein